jgi:SAM-dependent methyltransferase
MDFPIKENIYGHLNRLEWIVSHLEKSDLVVEFGCGTGFMISLQLVKRGYTVFGIDSDRKSIAYGREICRKEGLNPDTLHDGDIADLDVVPDVIIASEVLEHLDSDALEKSLGVLRSKLKAGGLLLVTVPNGYGWFELESFIWNRLLVGRIFEALRITAAIGIVRRWVCGKNVDATYPSTLSASPHVQRFTFDGIRSSLSEHGFRVIDAKGSVLFCGVFSNMVFTGIEPVMKANIRLGGKFPRIASAFYIACRKLD